MRTSGLNLSSFRKATEGTQDIKRRLFRILFPKSRKVSSTDF